MSYCLTLTVYYNTAVHTPMKDNDSGEKKFVDKLINDFFFKTIIVIIIIIIKIFFFFFWLLQ